MMMIKKLLFFCLLASCFFSEQASAFEGNYQWLELGANNRWIVRAITDQDHCPWIYIHEKNQASMKKSRIKLKMDIRHAKTKNFPVTICQKILSPKTSSVFIRHQKIPVPKNTDTAFRKILIMGDTGCRMKKGSVPQLCADPVQWPFPVVAKSGALFKPDLVIHVGDYYYRESLGELQGDNWATWEADFFKPAKPLLKVAPFIFSRGNHEICERGGNGWTYLLDPFEFQHCVNHSPVYGVQLNPDTRLWVIDSGNANDVIAPANETKQFEQYLKKIVDSPVKHNWIITHKPFWFIFTDSKLSQAYQANLMNTLENAWSNIQPANVDLILSGHVHRFQALNFKRRPAQVIVGASGTQLDDNLARKNLAGMVIAGEAITQGLSLIHSGYMTLEQNTDHTWRAQFRSPQGKTLANCVFEHKNFICEKTHDFL